MAMESGMYAGTLVAAMTANADTVNWTTASSIYGLIVGSIAGGDCSATFGNITSTGFYRYGGANVGFTELATGHGYTQGAAPSSLFSASAFSSSTGAAAKIQWPSTSQSLVWTATDATGIVQAANTGIVVYFGTTTDKDLIVFDYITGANSATGAGATYTATWASGVFTIQIQS